MESDWSTGWEEDIICIRVRAGSGSVTGDGHGSPRGVRVKKGSNGADSIEWKLNVIGLYQAGTASGPKHSEYGVGEERF